MEQLEGVSVPPLPSIIWKKTPKPRRRRQAALRRFLVTSAMIGCKYAPDLDGPHPQGVQWDSLSSFKLIGEVQRVETPVL
jgi:hypothetical protein